MTHTTEPKIDWQNDSFEDLLYDADGKGFMSKITYEGVYYDGALRISKLEVTSRLRDLCDDDLIEALKFRNGGKHVVIECKMDCREFDGEDWNHK